LEIREKGPRHVEPDYLGRKSKGEIKRTSRKREMKRRTALRKEIGIPRGFLIGIPTYSLREKRTRVRTFRGGKKKEVKCPETVQ